MASAVEKENIEFNKNEKQLYFNRVKGSVSEISLGEIWCSITLIVGHENSRLVNFCFKKEQYEKFIGNTKVGDKIGIRFFLTSRYKNGRWHTNANILQVDTDA
jgi:hypothetical protein